MDTDHDASVDASLMAGDDEEFTREIVRIMTLWTIVVVAAGIGLVLAQGSLTGLV